MVAKNDITGDAIQSRTSTKAYEDNYDRIFGKKKKSTDDYQDVLSTEDCVVEALDETSRREKALDELARINQELGLYDEPKTS